MFKFLTKNKKGFTLIELMAVLLLLSLGFVALGNMFKVTYRAFNKAEERYIKQEEVKLVAEMLRKGSTNVAAASYADIFDTTSVIPTKGSVDLGYSYLYFEPHRICSTCEGAWDAVKKHCSDETCTGTDKVDGYFLKCLNSGTQRNCDLDATKTCEENHCKCPNKKTSHLCKECSVCQCTEKSVQLSNVPIYIRFEPMTDYDYKVEGFDTDEDGNWIEVTSKGKEINSCGVTIILAALEDDFVYESKNAAGEKVLNTPTSDDIFYSVDVAYHFPNMVLSPVDARVGYTTKTERSTAAVYDANGKVEKNILNESGEATGETYYEKVLAVDDCLGGPVLRISTDSIISRDSVNASLKTPKLCFIATASYGRDSSEVGLLCDFRDKCLLTNPIGTAFVNAYYKLSPPIAEFIADSEPLKAAVRVALKPLVAIATNALDDDAATENAPWFIMFMLCGAGATATLIKVDKRRKKAKE